MDNKRGSAYNKSQVFSMLDKINRNTRIQRNVLRLNDDYIKGTVQRDRWG